MSRDTPAAPRASRQTLAAIATVVAVVLAADLLLSLALRSARDARGPRLDDRPGLREEIAAAGAHDGRSLLLIGDSVLAGNVLERQVARGSIRERRALRVLDALRRETSPSENAAFRQVALDALLPVDLERIVGEIERIDPQAGIELVVEINLRAFSPHYREAAGCTREWICALPRLEDEGFAPADALALWLDELRSRVPVWRLRRHLEIPLLPPADRVAVDLEARGRDDGLAEEARVLDHYRVELGGESEQLAALDRVLRSLAKSGRRALFFATPLNDEQMLGLHDAAGLSALYGEIARRIHDLGGPRVGFVSFDHPLFDPRHFVDHVHLTSEGNRLLAINLLAELKIRLDRPPDPASLAFDHGIERTLVSGGDVGYVEGPPWTSRFRKPDGIAFDAESRRLFIADRENHVIRVMRGELRNVERYAGAPGRAGQADGALDEARFDAPRRPVVLAGRVFLLDAMGRRLRVIEEGRVRTILSSPEPRFVDLTSNGRKIHVLDVRGAVHMLHLGRLQEVISAPEDGTRLTNLALSSSNEIFLAGPSRIWRGRLDPKRSRSFAELDLWLPDTGRSNLPDSGDVFPMSFEDVHFSRITDIVYVDRYQGLLVLDLVSLSRRGRPSDESARAHLRFLEPGSRRVFPWIRPWVNGNAHFPQYFGTPTRASAFHDSSIALDPSTADLYLLETLRSRLIRIGDGLHAASRVSDSAAPSPSPFGNKSSRETIAAFRPQDLRAARVREAGLRAHLAGLYVGSSMIVGADRHGHYALARALERELGRQLGLSERIQVDIYLDSHPGAVMTMLAALVRQFLVHQFIPDFVLVDLNEMMGEMEQEMRSGTAAVALADLKRLGLEHGFELVIVDNSGLGARRRDALRPRSPLYQEFLEGLRQAGFRTIELTPELLPAHLEIAPWANEPFKPDFHHGSPQAIDRTAHQLAARLAPILIELAETAPGPERRRRLPVRLETRVSLHFIASRDGGAPFDREPRIPMGAVRTHLDAERLEVLVDVRKLARLAPEVAAGESGVFSAIRSFVLQDVRGRMIDALDVRFVEFANYDEYGRGTLEDAKIVYEARVDGQWVRDRLERQ